MRVFFRPSHRSSVTAADRRVRSSSSRPNLAAGSSSNVQAARTKAHRPGLPCHAQSAPASFPMSDGVDAGATAGYAQALAWKPQLSIASELLCLVISGAITAAAAALTPHSLLRLPPLLSASPTTRRIAALALLFALTLLWLRNIMLERLWLDNTRPETELGDPDSCFATLAPGVQAHYKAAMYGEQLRDLERLTLKDRLAPLPSPPSHGDGPTSPFALHCYHGFGANLFSFDLVLRRLSKAIPALVTSHDMPGFGLTSRPPAGPSYYLTFNGHLGWMVQERELRRVGLAPQIPEPVSGLKPHDKQAQQEDDAATPAPSPGASSITLSSLASSPSGFTDVPLSESSATPPSPSPSQQQLFSSSSSSSSIDVAGSGGRAEGGASVLDVPVAATGAAPRVKRVLVGHSMGCICAAMQALEAPQDVAALVLIAPAILVMPSAGQLRGSQLSEVPLPALPAGSQAEEAEHKLLRRFVPSGSPGAQAAAAATAGGTAAASTVAPAWVRLAARVQATLHAAALLLVLGLLRLLRPLLLMALRSSVRDRLFWQRGLSLAWHDKAKLKDKAVDEYRLPQLVRGWELGMCHFLEARLAPVTLSDLWKPWVEGPSHQEVTKAEGAVVGEEPSEDLRGANLAAKLADIVRRRHQAAAATGADAGVRAAPEPLRVLVVHGRGDTLVPLANSERLTRMLPSGCGCELVVVERCGHMPHEEHPQLFVKLVAEFLSRS